MILPQTYIDRIKGRSLAHKIIGLVPRLFLFVKFSLYRNIARMRGAKIGHDTVLSFHTAFCANKNLVIGDDCAVFAKHLDLRARIIIADHVIINKDVTILRLSHSLETPGYETIHYPDLEIGSHVWLATGAKVLPQVTKIDDGAVCAAYSVISKNCSSDMVYAGNPARIVKERGERHLELVVCSLNGGDMRYYIKAIR